MERKSLQEKILQGAAQAGFSHSEVFYLGRESFEVLMMEGEISKYENSREEGLSFRGNYNGRTGYAYTERLTEESIPYLLREAKGNALLLPTEDMEELYGGGEYVQFDGYAPALEQVPAEKRIALAKRMEYAALHGAQSIAALDYCVLSMVKKEVAIQNSLGLNVSYVKNAASGKVTAIAKQGEETKTGSFFWKGWDWAKFDPEKTGREAAERAAALLGAEPVASGKYQVVLNGEMMTAMLSVFRGIFFGENAQKGFSLLKGREGEKIAADCVTLRDDALLPDGYGSVPFDSEGVAGQNKAVIERGVLKTLLYNRKSAKKAGLDSTGNGLKGGLATPVQTACTNFYILPGGKNQEALLAEMGEGILITRLMGLHAGANPVSGDFSLLAEGFYIKEGKAMRGVEQITVAGNFYDLLKNIREVGSDLYFSGSGLGAPAVWMGEMNIGGK